MKHILYLPSWFPGRNKPYPGDFIKRHAEAASLYNRITVLFTAVDDKINEPVVTEEKINENLSIYIFYYPSKTGMLSSAINGIKRFAALKKMYAQVFKSSLPDLVHVHVAFPAGLFALYLKKRKGLEYIISEHDGIYMPGYDNYHVPGQFEKRMVPVIYGNAKAIHAVSNSLAASLEKLKLSTRRSYIIPNVVDTRVFTYQKKKKPDHYRFIHISSLINQKNPEGMLEAFALVKQKRNDFNLNIIGPVNEKLRRLAHALSLQNDVSFTGELPYTDVAKQIIGSDAMIHFTRYETFGCVIAESLCCGTPVIVSDLSVTRELITDKVNGLLVKEADINDLADKVIYFMEGGLVFNAIATARENSRKFNYQHVGKMFDEMYNEVISSR